MKIAFVFLDGRLQRLGQIKGDRRGFNISESDTYQPSEFFLGAFELKKSGHEIAIFEISESENIGKQWSVLEKIVKLKWLPVKTYMGIIAACHPLVKNLNKFDVIVATTAGISFSLAMWKSCGILKAPIIAIQCGILNYEVTYPRKLFTKWLTKKMLVQLYGEGELNEITKAYDVQADNFEINLFGVDLDFWQPAPDEQHRNYILSVGNDANRDFNTLISAAKSIEHPVKIVTKRELGTDIPDNVEILSGHWKTQEITDLELRSLYQNAIAVVIPLKQTLQPSGQSVALQAMACGTSVIMTKTKGLWKNSHFDDKKIIEFVDVNEVGELSRAINRLIDDNVLRKTLRKNSKQYVKEFGSIVSFARRLESSCKLYMNV